ncbi:MAG: hypothetical protein QXL57_07545 [Candidatus Bathyarchaeia archaeon]
MSINVEGQLKALRLTKEAFDKVKPTSKHKRETLRYAVEQIKPLLKRYMRDNHVLAIELDYRKRRYLVLEPMPNAERQFWVNEWLEGDIPTKKLKQKLKVRYQWVQYLSFSDFLSGVEAWLLERMGKVGKCGF